MDSRAVHNGLAPLQCRKKERVLCTSYSCAESAVNHLAYANTYAHDERATRAKLWSWFCSREGKLCGGAALHNTLNDHHASSSKVAEDIFSKVVKDQLARILCLMLLFGCWNVGQIDCATQCGFTS